MNLNKSKRQVILLYSCTIIGIFLGVLVSIVNTRFLEPSSYGDVRYVNNIIAFFLEYSYLDILFRGVGF